MVCDRRSIPSGTSSSDADLAAERVLAFEIHLGESLVDDDSASPGSLVCGRERAAAQDGNLRACRSTAPRR